MPHENTDRIIHDVLLGLPLIDRLSALLVACIEEEPHALNAVLSLVCLVGVMTRCLPPAERLAATWALSREVEKINARWN